MEKEAPEKKKKSHFGLKFLGFLLFVLLLAALVLYIIPLTETDKGGRIDGAGDWMAQLPNERPLNELTIPGTHDSATHFVTLGFFGKCQTKSIADQLEAGFRYLDIRLAVDKDKPGLKLMHGFVNCRTNPLPWAATLYLDEVLKQCYEFLDKHPTETILFAVKQEHGKDAVADFQRLLDNYIVLNADRWMLTDTMPTLGEARGKLVLLRRYEDEANLGANAGISLIWDGQGSTGDMNQSTAFRDNGNYTLWVQDRYSYPVEEKWTAFIGGLGAGSNQEGALTLSFLSTKGKLPFGHPYKYASDLNNRLLGRELRAEDGWIIVDFATAPLAKHIYEANFH